VEEALRRAVESTEAQHVERVANQTRYLDELDGRVDASVLAFEQMWR
jgi:hypothetical protein